MKPIFRRRLLSVLGLALVSGCVMSEQPLSAVKDARPDPQLVGTWQAENEANPGKNFRISYDAQGLGRIAQKQEDGTWPSKTDTGTFFVTKTDQALYLNLLIPDDDKQPEKGQHYQFFKYAVSEDRNTLRVWATKLPPFQKAVGESKLKGHLDSSDNKNPEQQSVILQDSSATILHFLENLPTEEAFGEVGVYKHVD